MLDFAGRTVVITGAAGGIGSEMVGLFRELGAAIVACDRDGEGLARLSAERRVAFDLADNDAVSRAAGDILDGGAVPAAVISNAGVTTAETLAGVDDALFDAELAQNLTGAATFSRAFLPAMRAAGGGAFVFVSSVNALAHFGNPAYAAAKAGLGAWMRAIATEEGAAGIRANAVAPGSVRTAAWAARIAADPGILDDVRGLYPLGRLVTPREVAMAAAFLASPLASGITGVTLNVDAGLMAGNLPFLKRIMEV
jgi:NAD(P)-dependent dehydrogenase (short-subunit alcohol dehydrogenase family)